MGARVGTASEVNGQAGNGSTSVTVPAGTTAAVAMWVFYRGISGEQVTSLSLGGSGMTVQAQEATPGDLSTYCVGVATLVNPPTGTQTFAWNYTTNDGREEGGKFIITYVNGIDTTNLVRAAGTDSNINATNTFVTLSTETTDLLLAACCSATTSTPVLDGANYIDDSVLQLLRYDACEVTPIATSTTVNMTGEDFSSMVAISLFNFVGSGSDSAKVSVTESSANLIRVNIIEDTTG